MSKLVKQSQGQVKVSHTSIWKVLRRQGLVRINHPSGRFGHRFC
jgi:hypothetical protein